MGQLIAVSQQFTVNQGNDPTSPIYGYTDLALLLSEYYGKNIRQGASFQLMGYAAHLSCDSASDDADTGLSVQGVSRYVPTTKHSRAAWNKQFQRWRRQKQLSGNIGAHVRNDDMEMAFDAQGQTSRTSTIYAGGIGDSDGAESLTITGTSATGVRSSLTDFYNSLNPIPENSRTEFGTNIKEPKYLSHFPATQEFTWTAHASSMAQWTYIQDDLVSVGSDYKFDPNSVHYMNASSHQDFVAFPGDSYVPVFCGLMQHIYYVLPPDVDTGENPPTAEDDWTLTITFYVKAWTPLVYKPRKKLTGGYSRKPRKSRGKRRYKRRT